MKWIIIFASLVLGTAMANNATLERSIEHGQMEQQQLQNHVNLHAGEQMNNDMMANTARNDIQTNNMQQRNNIQSNLQAAPAKDTPALNQLEIAPQSGGDQ
tara:strand:- start:40255 stop:40557 length:303 start_codon:yes stop_codon:yes gene_type:complete